MCVYIYLASGIDDKNHMHPIANSIKTNKDMTNSNTEMMIVIIIAIAIPILFPITSTIVSISIHNI